MKKRVLIVGHGGKPEIREMVTRVTPWLAARCEIAGTQMELDGPLRPPDCDLVLVFGGDGSILAAARQLQECEAPVVALRYPRWLLDKRGHDLMNKFRSKFNNGARLDNLIKAVIRHEFIPNDLRSIMQDIQNSS